MTPEEWVAKVKAHEAGWEESAKDIGMAEWQEAVTRMSHRVGAWQRMTPWQRMKIRIRGEVARFRRILP